MAPLSSMFSVFCILLTRSVTNALAPRSQNILAPFPAHAQTVLDVPSELLSHPMSPAASSAESTSSLSNTLQDLLAALNVMQDEYFEFWQGTWPDSIDWTAAVLGTHVSATLSSLTSTVDDKPFSKIFSETDVDFISAAVDHHRLALENLINHFFDHTTAFYFGEDSFAVRNQAFDDMLWVVLGWLESIKFQELHSDLHFDGSSDSDFPVKPRWHGTQLQLPAAHRARLFYGLASGGWDEKLCGGGMIWSPYLTPYKNAITNELFISASIGMYLYFPGDVIDSPFVAEEDDKKDKERWSDGYPHHLANLQAAIEGYKWLNASNMTGPGGLYADGFHISGWQDSDHPGSGKCDELNTMVYTYNQGVILSGLRGLWLATGSPQYLDDGHLLVRKVLAATGWPDRSSKEWAGLGRGGVLEDACDASGSCSQNAHTFKGIFFHHLTEFCRPVRPQEARFLTSANQTTEPGSDWQNDYEWHQARCRTYRPWIEHNANAALMTRDAKGKIGTWWGKPYGDDDKTTTHTSPLPRGAVDYRNYGDCIEGLEQQKGALRTCQVGSEHKRTHKARDSVETNDSNDRGRGRTVETQSGGVAVLRALYQWKNFASLTAKGV